MRQLALTGILAFVLLLLGSMEAFSSALLQTSGTTYYVATNGNDANPGTEASPFRTLAKGVSVLRAGDTLLVKEGLYEEEVRSRSIASGESWDRPVTLQAYPGHTVTIRPRAGATNVVRFSGNQQYIIIDGFILDGINVNIEVIKVAGVADPNQQSPSHIRIMNNEIKNSTGASTYSTYKYYGSGILVANSDYIEIINNIIHHNGKSDLDHGIYQRGSYGLTEGNIIYANTGTGVKIGWDSSSLGNTVRNNLIYDNNASQAVSAGERQGRGIGVYSSTGTMVYNNLVLGRHFIGIDITYGGHEAKIFNNTVSITTGSGIVIGYGSGGVINASNAIVRNNIVYQQSNNPAIQNQRGGGNTTIEYNLTFGVNASIRQDGGTSVIRNNLESVNPQFVNPSTGDFRLSAASPAINAGLALSDVPFDYDKVTRPQGGNFDIGAYEFINDVPVGPTMRIDVTPWVANPGQNVNVALSFVNVTEVYGLQVECSVDPLVLTGISLGEGDTFTSANSLLVDRGYNTTGSWLFAASRMSPHPAVSGNGVAFNLTYQVQSAGSSSIDCSATAVDRDGRELLLTVVDGSYNMSRPPSNPQATPISVTPTPPVVNPTPVPTTSSLSTISGLVVYQSQSSNEGIRIQLLQESAVIGEAVTNPDGSYQFTDVPVGSYNVQATAPQHLTIVRNIQLGDLSLNLGTDTLMAGDVDDNSVIDIVDAGLIGANFGLEGGLFPSGDLNRDSTIDISDLVLVGSNFGLAGPIMVQ
jgi:hypothetical protein